MKYILLILFLVFNLAQAKTITVCKTCEVNTVKGAMKLAKDGDIIHIKKGVYKEIDIDITKQVVINGEKGAIIDGDKKGEIFHIKADHVTLRGLTIQNVGISFTSDHAAVRLTNSKYFLLEKLTLRNMFFGIYVAKSSQGTIRNNHIEGIAKDEYNSGNGIHLWYAQHILIENNFITGSRDGIYFEFADHCTIKNNVSTKNLRYGLHFMFSNDDEYLDNKFIANGAGVAVMFSKRIQMLRNEFKNNWGNSAYGLLLKEIYDADIKENIFSQNTIGIQVDGSTRINYFNNTFSNNGWAVKMQGAAYANIFKKNNFLNNSFDLAYNSNVNDNVFEQNYWSEYTGYDLDKDGIGDVPYRPVKLFAYIVDKTPESIILLRSLFVDIINFSEKISPVFTPDNLQDMKPQMKPL
ncbi:MAG: nitrous oxide reductase family maturation protein NosD [Weeksellaceae bacterium]